MHIQLHYVAFAFVAISILAIGSYYTGFKLIHWSGVSDLRKKKLWMGIKVFLLVESICFFSFRIFPAYFNKWLLIYWITYSALGMFAVLVMYTLFADGVLIAKRYLSKASPTVNMERRSALMVGTLALGSTVAGAAEAVTGPNVYQVEIPLKNLPDEFENFRIVQISDLHVGPTIDKAYVEHVVGMANRLDADLIALTGDFVDGFVDQLRDALSPIAQLRARHGMFYITGNHEYMWDAPGWINEFKRMGAKVLLNEHVMIEQQGQSLVLAGVTDRSAVAFIPEQRSDPRKAIAGAPQNAVKILLAHQPASYEDAAPAGFDLQLSGHTHGGQFFPFNIVVSMFQRYYKGLNRHENLWIYVNRGTGYWGPPTRLGIPAEITLITLKRAQETNLHET